MRELDDERQENQLSTRVRGGEDAHHQAAVCVKPALGHNRAENQGHHAGADADEEAPQHPQLPQAGHDGGETGAERHQCEARDDDSFDAEAFHCGCRERRCQAVKDEVRRHGAGRSRAAPAEFVLERFKERARSGAECCAGQQGKQRDGNNQEGVASNGFHYAILGTEFSLPEPCCCFLTHRLCTEVIHNWGLYCA